MTDDEIRIAVSESVGWMCIGPCTCGHKEPCGLHPDPHRASGRIHLPNYLEDLNAIHAVEKTLTFAEAGEYERLLAAVSKPRDGSCPTPSYHYSARQRCEAYLRTIGKWRE